MQCNSCSTTFDSDNSEINARFMREDLVEIEIVCRECSQCHWQLVETCDFSIDIKTESEEA